MPRWAICCWMRVAGPALHPPPRIATTPRAMMIPPAAWISASRWVVSCAAIAPDPAPRGTRTAATPRKNTPVRASRRVGPPNA